MEKTWADVRKYVNGFSREAMEDLIIDLAAANGECNSCDDASEVLRVIEKAFDDMAPRLSREY